MIFCIFHSDYLPCYMYLVHSHILQTLGWNLDEDWTK